MAHRVDRDKEKLLQIISTYVPPPVLRDFTRNPKPVEECKSSTCEGTCMFAGKSVRARYWVFYIINMNQLLPYIDISGYTRMTEVFAKEGAIGAEKISGVLNKYFGLQGDIIISYGGDVMRYAGDGLLALWPLESWGFNTAEDLCQRAVKCSMQMLSELNNYPITKGVELQVGYVII
jgi:hypothetical protein